MKKSKGNLNLNLLENKDSKHEQIVPLRIETVLSQYPLHKLDNSKKPHLISITKKDQFGKTHSVWEVEFSPKYGPPGRLASKLDSILISRLIDIHRPNIPDVIKLGSYRDICKELGIALDVRGIKTALYQNAFASITARIEYVGYDGKPRKFEFGTTRYGVVFAGETLPNDHTADVICIVLNPIYKEVLKYAKIRPLDYEYLKQLSPASRRLYELISFQIFAAIRNDNPRAKYIYSELCRNMPLTRYYDWEQVKKQLYKVHNVHRKSGYINKIEYNETFDSDGNSDWVIWYTPGPKAFFEYSEFASRKHKLLNPAFNNTQTNLQRKGGIPENETDPVVDKLIELGISNTVAIELVKFDRLGGEQWAEAWQYQNKKGMNNPPAVLKHFIETKNRAFPKEYINRKKSEEKLLTEQLRTNHKSSYLPSYHSYLDSKCEELKRDNQTYYSDLLKNIEVLSEFPQFSKSDIKMLRYSQIEEFFSQNPELSGYDFWEWDKHLNPNRFIGPK